MSTLIRAQCAPLELVARHLNTPDSDLQPAGGEAAAVAVAVLATKYPKISPEAAERFNALADEAPVYFLADATGAVRSKDRGHLVVGLTSDQDVSGSLPWTHIRTKHPAGVWAAWLADLIVNPQRERLRRCPQCGRWFVDLTRNKAAVRCSRACTIAWWNKQRPKGGAR